MTVLSFFLCDPDIHRGEAVPERVSVIYEDC